MENREEKKDDAFLNYSLQSLAHTNEREEKNQIKLKELVKASIKRNVELREGLEKALKQAKGTGGKLKKMQAPSSIGCKDIIVICFRNLWKKIGQCFRKICCCTVQQQRQQSSLRIVYQPRFPLSNSQASRKDGSGSGRKRKEMKVPASFYSQAPARRQVVSLKQPSKADLLKQKEKELKKLEQVIARTEMDLSSGQQKARQDDIHYPTLSRAQSVSQRSYRSRSPSTSTN